MGTRHLTAVFLNGEYRVAQYGQWDGYPSGAGLKILSALQNGVDEDSLADFKAKVATTKFLSDEEHDARWRAAGADSSGFATKDVSDLFEKNYPALMRDMGAGIIEYLMESLPGAELHNSIDFASDSLFCEYAYVIDFDKNTFEVYKGFVTTPLDPSERFFAWTKEKDHRDEQYFPVKHAETFDLNNLPSPEDFLKALRDDAES